MPGSRRAPTTRRRSTGSRRSSAGRRPSRSPRPSESARRSWRCRWAPPCPRMHPARSSARSAPPSRELAPALEQVLVADVPQFPGWDAHDHLARRDVLQHDRTGTDHRLLADFDAGQDDRAASHPAGAPKRRTLRWLARSVAAHRVVVGQDDPWAEEGVVLDLRPCRDVAVALDLDAGTDRHVVVDRTAPADHGLGADPGTLPHLRLVTDQRGRSDLGARGDDGTRGDCGVLRQRGRRRRLRRGGRVPAERRWLSDHRRVADHAEVPDPSAGVDDHVAAQLGGLADLDTLAKEQAWRQLRGLERAHGRAWISPGRLSSPLIGVRSRTGAPSCSREAWSASSTVTTLTPAAPSVWGRSPVRRHSMKCAHSSRNGSVFRTIGLWTGPERVMYSP